MANVIFNSGFIGLLIWLLLFAVSTAALALILRCAVSLREAVFWGNELQYYQPSEKIHPTHSVKKFNFFL